MKSTEYHIMSGVVSIEECDRKIKPLSDIFYLKGVSCIEDKEGKCFICGKHTEKKYKEQTYKCIYDKSSQKITCDMPNIHSFTAECIISRTNPIMEIEQISLYSEEEGES